MSDPLKGVPSTVPDGAPKNGVKQKKYYRYSSDVSFAYSLVGGPSIHDPMTASSDPSHAQDHHPMATPEESLWWAVLGKSIEDLTPQLTAFDMTTPDGLERAAAAHFRNLKDAIGWFEAEVDETGGYGWLCSELEVSQHLRDLVADRLPGARRLALKLGPYGPGSLLGLEIRYARAIRTGKGLWRHRLKPA